MSAPGFTRKWLDCIFNLTPNYCNSSIRKKIRIVYLIFWQQQSRTLWFRILKFLHHCFSEGVLRCFYTQQYRDSKTEFTGYTYIINNNIPTDYAACVHLYTALPAWASFSNSNCFINNINQYFQNALLTWELLSCSLVKTHEAKWNFKLSSHLLNHALCPFCLNWSLPSSRAKPRPARGQAGVFFGTNFKVNKLLHSSSPLDVGSELWCWGWWQHCQQHEAGSLARWRATVHTRHHSQPKRINTVIGAEAASPQALLHSPLWMQQSKIPCKGTSEEMKQPGFLQNRCKRGTCSS